MATMDYTLSTSTLAVHDEFWYNLTTRAPSPDCSDGPPMNIRATDPTTICLVLLYSVVCVMGLLGNGLVIYVVVKYSSMKTPTNLYLVNLSIADALFLVSLPLFITLMLLHHWIFGSVLCVMYNLVEYVYKSAGTYTLVALSGDRYLAVCHPVSAARYRTTQNIGIIIAGIWTIAIAIGLAPAIHSVLIQAQAIPCAEQCHIVYYPRSINTIYTVCSILFGFLFPVLSICIFYSLLVTRLATSGAKLQAAQGEKRRTQNRKVTLLVTLVIAVYSVCWLPFWAVQGYVLYVTISVELTGAHTPMSPLMRNLFLAASILRYVNSMVNPLLYTFTNEHFRKSFVGALRCLRDNRHSVREDDGRSHIDGTRIPLTSATAL
jgi:hypothetical protein